MSDRDKPAGFLGIDTSNYTTSLSLCNEDGEVVMNLRRILDVKAGERGLRQSDAVFSHTKNIPMLMNEASELLSGYDILAVACSSKPRSLEDSYMPCFLVGKSVASSVAATAGVPCFEVSHQDGHVMAAAYSSNRMDELLSAPFCAFHVSGGTTEILRVTPCGGDAVFSVELVGGTLDLNAGQTIDRIGVMMGLGFPCGKELEALADSYKGELPPIKTSVKGLECNLSGLESIASGIYSKSQDKGLTSKFVLEFLADTFIKLTRNLTKAYPGTPLLYAGGVMSNKYLQARLGECFTASFAVPEFSADNAAGVALLCREKYRNAVKNKGKQIEK